MERVPGLHSKRLGACRPPRTQSAAAAVTPPVWRAREAKRVKRATKRARTDVRWRAGPEMVQRHMCTAQHRAQLLHDYVSLVVRFS
jgi:hypothetical protein